MGGVECGENPLSHPLRCRMACREDMYNLQLLFVQFKYSRHRSYISPYVDDEGK
jgi:hypothetical protein